jgi:cysteinyl-tRNA synthetase
MPDHLPKATEHVPQIVHAIEELIGLGHAYPVEGDVYYRVGSFAEYGRLSGQRADQVEEQEPNALKEDPRDFALWKANKPDEDTKWDSPWGPGRPGWHIECSVMAEELLGTVFEIHGGGLDLVFPHHENEIAQSRALGHPFAQLWMHNGLLQFTGEKMSKSEGESVSIRDAIDRWGAETLLLFFMTGHWRKPLDFSEQTMAQAAAQVQTFRDGFGGEAVEPSAGEWDRLVAVLDDDFNTPDALRIFHDWRRAGYHDLVRRGLDIFGLATLAEQVQAPPEIVELAEERREARAERDWTESDRLRDEIAARGWDVRDEGEGYVLVPRS